MKAVVLVGGEGTRLRPLTETIPKPLVPLVDRPFLHQVLDHLGAHGVHEVILSSSYLEASFEAFLAERHGDPAVAWITEASPLGTAGAIANAAARLDETFLVLNGDILTDLNLTELVAEHRARGAVATITLTRVEDARPFGLVEMDPERRVLAFREKPADAIPGTVNAGTYVLEPEAIAGVASDVPVSIEREVFPSLIEGGAPVWGFVSDAYWIDLGTPEKYLQASFDVLDGRVSGLSYPAPYLADGARVDARAKLGRRVIVSAAVTVAERAEVEDSVLLEGASVGAGAQVRGSILGPWSLVGPEAIAEGAVLAEKAEVLAGARCRDERVSAGAPFG